MPSKSTADVKETRAQQLWDEYESRLSSLLEHTKCSPSVREVSIATAKLSIVVAELCRRASEGEALVEAYEWLTNGDSKYFHDGEGLQLIEWTDPLGECNRDFVRLTSESPRAFVVRAFHSALYETDAIALSED